MTSTYESIMEAALRLDPKDRCRVAAELWESVGEALAGPDGDVLEGLLDQREAEMEHDPSLEIGHAEFLATFAKRRRA